MRALFEGGPYMSKYGSSTSNFTRSYQIVEPRIFEFKKTLTPLPFQSACSGSRNSFREMNQGCLLGISYLRYNRNTVFEFFTYCLITIKRFTLKDQLN